MSAELTKLRILDLFSGIGGFSLGLERTGGFRTVAFCEINPFARQVLSAHWPNVKQYGDVRELTAERLAADGVFPVDVICGGFPCQDISTAGPGDGIDGERSGLWTEFARLIGDLRPRYVIVENVANLLVRGIDRVLGGLAALGYDAEWQGIPASALGAFHDRDRIWIVAYPSSQRHAEPRLRWEIPGDFAAHRAWETSDALDALRRGAVPVVCREAHGLPNRVDRLATLGNAVVPQIPEIIGSAILAAEKDRPHAA